MRSSLPPRGLSPVITHTAHTHGDAQRLLSYSAAVIERLQNPQPPLAVVKRTCAAKLEPSVLLEHAPRLAELELQGRRIDLK